MTAWTKVTRLLPAASLIALMAASGVSAQELLTNGDFEGGFQTTPYGSVANSWEPCGRPSLAGASYQSASYTGLGYYQKIVLPNVLGSETGICQRVTGLIPGAIVKFSATVYQKVPNCTVWMAIDPNSSLPVGALPSRVSQVPYRSGSWTYNEITATVGPSGQVAVYVWVYYESGSSSHLNVNDCSLTYADSTVHNLTVASALSDAIQLTWSAPAGAKSYEIRYADQPVTEGNWGAATVVTSQVPPSPLTSGAMQSTWVRGLTPSSTYYFGIRMRDASGTWHPISNSPSGTTIAAGVAPYWAWRQKEGLRAWYQKVLGDCQAADANSGAGGDPYNLFKWYFGGWDSDCEHNPPIGALLQVVRDPWILGFMDRLCDHLWELGYASTCIDRDIYNATRQKVPTWNESHHGGERSWAGVTMTAVDYDNPKWVQRLVEYARHVHFWTGYTGNPPHLHFRSFWVKGDEWNRSAERGPQSLVDNPEDRRFTRALEYAAWRDPNSRMPDGKLISDFLVDLDTASAEDCMKTDLSKPLGVWPGEIRFDNHQIGGYSGQWWRMAGSMGGTVGTSGEWWWDWRYGWVQARDAYYELVDRFVVTGDPKFIIPVRETLRYFSQTAAVNSIPPQYMGDPPTFPWPVRNDPWGGYQYIVNYLYRQYTGDTQFDAAWLAHANVLKQTMPAPGATRYLYMNRATLAWDTAQTAEITPQNPFFMAWKATRDKEWLCKALDEMAPADQFQITWYQAMYNGVPTANLNRLPDQPITWNNTTNFTDFASLVTDWDNTHIRWVTCSFAASDKSMPIWLWSLKPGNYVLRHGPDANGDDRIDSVAESIPFTYSQRKTALTLVLPAGRVEAWEIVPASAAIPGVKALADGTPARIANAIVTAAFDGFFYVEDATRTSGIRVESLAAVQPGDIVELNGYLTTTAGERCMKCITVTRL